MIYCYLAPGFEEVEALAPVDLLRRAGLDVKTVGVGGNVITGSHGIPVKADLELSDALLTDALQAIILPGGMPGTKNLDADPGVQSAITYAAETGKLLCAICAAPSILGKRGLLSGKRATAFPGFEKEMPGAIVCGDSVVRDGNFITGKGAGAAVDFGLAIVAAFLGEETAAKLRATIQCP